MCVRVQFAGADAEEKIARLLGSCSLSVLDVSQNHLVGLTTWASSSTTIAAAAAAAPGAGASEQEHAHVPAVHCIAQAVHCPHA